MPVIGAAGIDQIVEAKPTLTAQIETDPKTPIVTGGGIVTIPD